MPSYTYKESTYEAEKGQSTEDPKCQCDTCGKRFYTKEKLDLHKKRLHGKDIFCPRKDCGYSCSVKRAYRMRDHILKAHDIPESEGKGKKRKAADSMAKPSPKTRTVVLRPDAVTPATPVAVTPMPSPPPAHVPHLEETRLSSPPGLDLLSLPAHMWASPVSVTDLLECALPDELLGGPSLPVAATSWEEETPLPAGPSNHADQGRMDQPVTMAGPVTNTSTQEVSTQTDPPVTRGVQTMAGPDTREEGTQATLTRGPVSTSTSICQTEEEPFHYLANDPRFFFLGAPSRYCDGTVAPILRDARRAALANRAKYHAKWVPIGFLSIMKEETFYWGDGQTFNSLVLKDAWSRPPTTMRLKTSETQTAGVCRCVPMDDEQPLDLSCKRARAVE